MNGGLSTLFLRFLKKFVILPPTPREGMGIMRRVALVTGASRGIGRGIALELAREGWDLCINYLQDRQAAETAAEEIRALGQNAGAFQADVADRAAVEAMVRRAEAELGPVSLLVNNAGVSIRSSFRMSPTRCGTGAWR